MRTRTERQKTARVTEPKHEAHGMFVNLITGDAELPVRVEPPRRSYYDIKPLAVSDLADCDEDTLQMLRLAKELLETAHTEPYFADSSFFENLLLMAVRGLTPERATKALDEFRLAVAEGFAYSYDAV